VIPFDDVHRSPAEAADGDGEQQGEDLDAAAHRLREARDEKPPEHQQPGAERADEARGNGAAIEERPEDGVGSGEDDDRLHLPRPLPDGGDEKHSCQHPRWPEEENGSQPTSPARQVLESEAAPVLLRPGVRRPRGEERAERGIDGICKDKGVLAQLHRERRRSEKRDPRGAAPISDGHRCRAEREGAVEGAGLAGHRQQAEPERGQSRSRQHG